MDQQIPSQIDEQYEGRWVAWDTVDEKVVGDGETLEEAIAAARARQTEHLIWYHHVVPREAVIVGGL